MLPQVVGANRIAVNAIHAPLAPAAAPDLANSALPPTLIPTAAALAMVRLLKPDRPRARNFLSRREQWRLLLLFVPLALVIVLIGRLRDPNFANRVNQVFAQASPPASQETEPPRSYAAPPPSPGLFAGVDPAWLKTITDNTYFRNFEKDTWFRLFGLLQRSSADELNAAHGIEASYVQLVDQPNFYRGKLVTVHGYLRQITEQTPAANDLGIKSYYRIVMQPTDGSSWPIFIYCLDLPPNLSLQNKPSEGYLKASGLFFKNLSYDWKDGLGTAPVIVAKGVEYYGDVLGGPAMLDIHVDEQPATTSDTVNPTIDQLVGEAPDETLGNAVLSNLGMDVKLLDEVKSRGPLRGEDREAFYQMLKAVGQIGSHQLARFAQQNLPAVRDEWQRRLASADSEPRRSMFQEALRHAAKGRYSVTPLFNDAQHQQGRLFVFDGTARRVVRVEVGSQSDGGPNDIARRFGFDHYYEMEVFTADSQNHPLSFCVRELPDGFPIGDSLYEPVRVAGFFFKDWLFRTRDSAGDDIQYAPLLIGRAPLRLPPEQSGSSLSRYVGVGLFVLGLAGIWIAAVVYARSDRQFRRRTAVADWSLPTGQSLNDLNLAAADRPVNSPEPILPTTGENP